MTMRAVVIREPGAPEVLETANRPKPVPGLDQILVRVRATAVNRADVLQRRGHYPAPAGVPAEIPGLEYAGEVEAVGGAVSAWRPGDRVMGLVAGGGYAEAVVVHEREAVPIPAGLDFAAAAAIPEAYITAYDALFTRLGVAMGERVLIHAVGSGVGTAALQLARSAGARVLGTARSAVKLERARAYGLEPEAAVDAAAGGWVDAVLERTAGAGVDAILDLVGGRYVADDLRVVAERGRIAVVGLVGGRMAELDLGLLLRRRAQVTGTVLRTRPLEEKVEVAQAFRRHVLPLFEAGAVRPVVDRVLAMDDAAEAHRLVEADANFGKIVLVW